jgi:YD repeat-containing protein
MVVARTTNSNGIGGTFDKEYFYVGVRRNADRRQFIGFQRFDVTDKRNTPYDRISRTYFEQVFPLSGMVSQTQEQVVQPGLGITTIGNTTFTNMPNQIDNTPYNQRHFSYPQTSTATRYEVGGIWNGSPLSIVTTVNSFDLTNGTLYDQTVTFDEPLSSANGVTGGGRWIARTYFPSLFNDPQNWCLGRPQQTQQINTVNQPVVTQKTRTTATTWSGSYCRLTQVVAEPNNVDPNLKVTSDIQYDQFGNVSSTTVTGNLMMPRTTAISSAASVLTGQFPTSVINPLLEESKAEWDYDLGVQTKSIDANGITVSWQYDAFGRRLREDRPDGTATTWSYNACSAVSGGCVISNANNRMVVIETKLATGGATITDTWTYLDAFDRPIVTKIKTLSGAYNRIDRDYTSQGSVLRESAPCMWVGCVINYGTSYGYDLIGRLASVSRQIPNSSPNPATSTIEYLGLTTHVRDGLSKDSYTIGNAAGQIARSQDHNGYYQSFDYDPFGNVVRVYDSTGTLQSSVYNDRGMLKQRTDMDMGTWIFTPNALGEDVSQTDAKSQVTLFEYDLLGRLTKRTETKA